MAQLGPFTAKDLAIQYLDQYLDESEDFDQAVKQFTPECKYYTTASKTADTVENVNGVWQNLSDQELKDLTPPKFYDMLKDFDLSDEDMEDAWEEFQERRDRVFNTVAKQSWGPNLQPPEPKECPECEEGTVVKDDDGFLCENCGWSAYPPDEPDRDDEDPELDRYGSKQSSKQELQTDPDYDNLVALSELHRY